MTTTQLILDCQNGVKASQYQLVRRYAGMLMTVCRRYAKDEAMAKDLLQETFIRVFSNINSYEPTGSFEAWMRRIAVRRSLQWLEKNWFQLETQPDEMPEIQAPTAWVEKEMATEEIMHLVMGLPPGYRAVFNLYAVEGYNHQEVAEILGISENTSRSQLARARQLLQQKLIKLKINRRHEVGIVGK
ncbi:MAG: sigma-70 family RNA polymerase sigma factor [Bacteroidetes bacterium]|nr:sigma-70 family RNA polymerase sigma factor [Bacteroidota bacterium]